jgi:hypothetical protein
VLDKPPDPEFKSAERLAFEIYLRTGRRLAGAEVPERKFNPYHDPRNGQFTFAPGGPRSVGGVSGSDPRGVWKPEKTPRGDAKPPLDKRLAPALDASRLDALPTKIAPNGFQLANRGVRGPRRGRGPGRGRPPTDPKLLDDLFPGLAKSPAGAIVELVDGVADLTTAANELTREIYWAQARRLESEIRELDPNFQHDTFGEPDTIQGRVNDIKTLRLRRAVEFYRKRNDLRPLQVEVIKIMQDRADAAYDEAVELYDAGRLTPRLSREEAIGNYIDRAVRTDLRSVFNLSRIDTSRGQPVRVVGRAYDTSGTDRTYRIPDARVGNVAFDVTLTRKTLATPQVRGFFNADFRPDVVVIVRPRQLGGIYTYAINRPSR